MTADATTPRFRCFLAHVTSRGWVDYVIEERDKLDSYEDTYSIDLAEGRGDTPEAAVADALAKVAAGLDAHEALVEADIAGFATGSTEPIWAQEQRDAVAAVRKDVGSFTGEGWAFDAYHGFIKPVEQDTGWSRRLACAIHEDTDEWTDWFLDEDADTQAKVAVLLAA